MKLKLAQITAAGSASVIRERVQVCSKNDLASSSPAQNHGALKVVWLRSMIARLAGWSSNALDEEGVEAAHKYRYETIATF